MKLTTPKQSECALTTSLKAQIYRLNVPLSKCLEACVFLVQTQVYLHTDEIVWEWEFSLNQI